MINTNPFDPDPVTDCEQCSECKVWFATDKLTDGLCAKCKESLTTKEEETDG